LPHNLPIETYQTPNSGGSDEDGTAKTPRARHAASRVVAADVAYRETLGRRNIQSFIRLSKLPQRRREYYDRGNKYQQADWTHRCQNHTALSRSRRHLGKVREVVVANRIPALGE
jgi:hypothetical protein